MNLLCQILGITFITVTLKHVDEPKVIPVAGIKAIANEVNEDSIECKRVTLANCVGRITGMPGRVINQKAVKRQWSLFGTFDQLQNAFASNHCAARKRRVEADVFV
jgi:hypothetical protein